MLRDRQEDLIQLCKQFKVIQDAKETSRHYLMNGGSHTSRFYQFAFGFQDADFRKTIAIEFMEELGNLGLLNDADNEVGVILVPALGGITIGATLQHLFYGKKPLLLYAEKINGKLMLRRGFSLPEDKNVLIIDDAYSTGKSFRELRELCREGDAGPVVCCGAVVNRSIHERPPAEGASIIPQVFLIHDPIHSFLPEECPFCKEGYPLEKDGTIIRPIFQPKLQ